VLIQCPNTQYTAMTTSATERPSVAKDAMRLLIA
jgi:hypothetical protein